MSSQAMNLRRCKWNDEQRARSMRGHHRRTKSNRIYGVTYGFPQVIHKGGKP